MLIIIDVTSHLTMSIVKHRSGERNYVIYDAIHREIFDPFQLCYFLNINDIWIKELKLNNKYLSGNNKLEEDDTIKQQYHYLSDALH